MKSGTTIYLVIFIITLLSCNTSSQRNLLHCDKIDNKQIIDTAFRSFENDLFGYYKLENDTINTYKKFLSEITNMTIDLNAMISEESIKIAHDFKRNAKTDNSIWISYYDYNKDNLTEEEEISITSKLDQIETKEENALRVEQEKRMLILNYKGPLIQCLKNNSKNPDLTKIIGKLELMGPINQSIIASGFNAADPKITFKSIETRAFIAFEIYYYILMITQQ